MDLRPTRRVRFGSTLETLLEDQNLMEQPTRTDQPATRRKRRISIEEYALLTESAPGLQETLQEWVSFYKPATPGERELLEMAVMSSIQRRRVEACITERVNNQIRTAVFDEDCAWEDQVERYRVLLPTQPGAALVGLKRSALGLRFLISRWERLLRLLQNEETWYGHDRTEAINYQGAKGSTLEDLFAADGAYLTWLYCLKCQPAPKDADFIAMGNPCVMPAGMKDRRGERWMASRQVARQILEDLVVRQLADLRSREEQLRTSFEEPARDSAEVRAQVLKGPEGVRLLQQERIHRLNYLRAYEAFLKGRKETVKSGVLPGAPQPSVHEEGDADGVSEPEPGSRPAAKSPAERKAEANKIAPGAANGIGAPVVDSEVFRRAVRAADKLSPEEWDKVMEAAWERRRRKLATPPPPPPPPGAVFGKYMKS